MPKPLPPCLRPPAEDERPAPPLDVNDLVVRLEMEGVTDAVARNQFSYAGVRDMAEVHFPRLSEAGEDEPAAPASPGMLQQYLRGVSFAFPLLVCVAAMAVFRFSLWGGDVDANLAAAIGLGTVLSFVTTGGVMQILAHRSLFYSGVKQHRMAERCSLRWIGWGVVALLGSGVLLVAASLYFRLLPGNLAYAAVGFHLSLGLFWLSAGLLYTFDKTWGIMAAVVAGIALVIGLHLFGRVDLPLAQIAGILLASGLSFAIGAQHLRRRSAADRSIPRRQLLAYDLLLGWPFLVYGTLYYGFLFSDRLLAWTASTFGAPLELQFRGSYETALDVALIAFILQVGWVYPAVSRFFQRLQEAQGQLLAADAPQLARRMREHYQAALCWFAGWALTAGVLACAIATWGGFIEDPLVRQTSLVAIAGYTFVVIGLFNANLLFRLSRPAETLPPMIAAFVVNVTVGYALSRVVSYEWAVVGFVAGSLCLAALSTRRVRHHLADLDYHYYAAAA